jgi:hypothetical protein
VLSDLSEIDRSEIGRKLGHDLYRFGRAENNVEWGPRIVDRHDVRVAPDRFTKKWLQLRLGAFSRDRLFDESVTPEILMKIDVAECPILRVQLTHGAQTSTDWSIDRLNNDGAYALHNLAVMSTYANSKKGNHSFEEVYEFSRRTTSTGGLEPVQWLRLASVMLGPCFAEKPDAIPTIPLVTPIPLHTARFSTQVMQQLFTLMARRLSGRNALVKQFKKVCKTERSREQLVCLADSMHFGLKGLEYPWDVWLSDRVMQALIDWQNSLDENARAAATVIAMNNAPVAQFKMGELRSWNLKGGGYL